MSDKKYVIKHTFWISGDSHLLHEMPLDILLECGYNSAATGCQCIGHHKTERNEAHFRMVNEELERRGETQLEYFPAAKLGKFNGKGAY